MDGKPFYKELFREILVNSYQVQSDNTDFYRQAEKYKSLWRRMRFRLSSAAARVLGKLGYTRVNRRRLKRSMENLSKLTENLEGLEETYSSFRDDWSRTLMVSLLAYRVLGKTRVKLPTNTGEYWDTVNRTRRTLCKRKDTYKTSSMSSTVDYFELEEAGYPLRLHTDLMSVVMLFLLEQYGYEREGVTVRAEPGDVVIDGGAYLGDSSLYFAHRVGPQGRVIAFEFVPGNMEILRENIRLNPEAGQRITVAPLALWSESGEKFSFTDIGPGTRLGERGGGESGVSTTTIDDFVRKESIPRVDFIKLDVEGSELRILEGAKETIRKFKPKLAISVYHRDDDFVQIPRFIRELDTAYSFYLDHYTIHLEETILYAHVAEQAGPAAT